MKIYIYNNVTWEAIHTPTTTKKLNINKLVQFFSVFFKKKKKRKEEEVEQEEEKKRKKRHTGTLQSFTPTKAVSLCFSALKKKERREN